jgi:hypothetical protein
MLVVRSLALAETREVESFFRWSSQCQRCPSDGQHPRPKLDVKLRQTLNDITIENQFLILIIDSSCEQILNKKQITNLYYKLSITRMLQFTQLCYISNNYGDRYHLLSYILDAKYEKS